MLKFNSSHATGLFFNKLILHSAQHLKHDKTCTAYNPISSVIVAIIHDRVNEPRGWDSLLLNLFFSSPRKKDNLECSPPKKTTSTRQTHALLTHNNTMQEEGAWRFHCLHPPQGCVDWQFSCKYSWHSINNAVRLFKGKEDKVTEGHRTFIDMAKSLSAAVYVLQWQCLIARTLITIVMKHRK